MSLLDSLQKDPAFARRTSLIIVICSTVLLAAAQLLMKAGVQGHDVTGPVQLVVAIFTSPLLFLGYACLGISTIAMVIALKYGELSVLYPIISMTYVWVAGLSIVLNHEIINPWKVAGLITVVSGVAVMGRSAQR